MAPPFDPILTSIFKKRRLHCHPGDSSTKCSSTFFRESVD
jgi:hypothetical protein